MKKIITFILCTLYFNITNAQTTQHVVDSLFQYIDKSPITSNIFIDRVFPASGIQEFNQGSRIDTSNFMHFKQTWSDLNRASYIQNFKTIEQFKILLKNKNYQNNVVPIGIINTEFHQSNLGTNTNNANVNYSNGFMRNKTGKIPFVKKQATIISPLVSSARGSSIEFKVDTDFMLHKFGKQIKKLILQTNNSSFTLINNYAISSTNYNTSYTSSGIKVLKFIVTFNDNTTKITHGTVKVYVPNTYSARGNVSQLNTINADNDLFYQGYDENVAYQGQNEYRIYYDNVNSDYIINKPIFIIDGYDPGDKRKIETGDIGHQADKSIFELMKYNSNELVKELRDLGYDIIIVNHNNYKRNGKVIEGGSDYIQRNAYTFISLLRYINSIKQGNEPNVVIGPSMGGLISRYALAYMEKKLAETGNNTKWNHETRLWVSFDSPHQGANVPIGIQKGIQYYAEEREIESAKDFIAQLNKPVPKQMLVNHYTNTSQIVNGAANFRYRFQNELDNLGMPQNLRKIALVNGSITGNLNGISKSKYLELTTTPALFSFLLGGVIRVYTDYYHTANEKNGVKNEVFYGRTKIK